MTPRQKVEYVFGVVKQAQQQTFAKEQFMKMVKNIWDAVEAAEAEAQTVTEVRHADPIS